MYKVAIFKKGKGLFGGLNQNIEKEDIFIINDNNSSSSSTDPSDNLQNGIVSGNGVAWIIDFDYEVTPYVFNIGNVQYSTARKLVTLDPSHATLDRIDVIVAGYNASGNGTIQVLTGVPSANPVKPTITINQLEITTIDVGAGTTQSGVGVLVVYDENIEFITGDGTGGRADFDSVEKVFTQTKAIKLSGFKDQDEITFVGSNFNINEYSVLQFMISANAKWGYNGDIEVALFDNTIRVSDWMKIDGDPYNTKGNTVFFQSAIDSWQTIVIPVSKLNPTSINANKISIRKTTLGEDTFFIDLIRLQQGIYISDSITNIDNIVAYKDFTIYKAIGNTSKNLENGDLVIGWFSQVLFFHLAKYTGGDVNDINNFDEISPIDNP